MSRSLCSLWCAFPRPLPPTRKRLRELILVPTLSRLRSTTSATWSTRSLRSELEGWLAEHGSDLRALNYLASVILQHEMFRRELLQAQVYGPHGEAFQSGKAPLDPGFRRELFAVLGKAETQAESRLKQNPRDEDALYWAGVTHLTKAIFDLTLAKANLAALGEAKEARNYHVQLLSLNANCSDAFLAIGIYDYVMGGLPWYMKVFGSLVGYRGDKVRGLAEIKRVTEQGHWAREDAKSFLAILYFREKMYAEALAILQGLYQSYPRNHLLLQEIARVYKAQGDRQSSVQVYETMLAKHAAHEPGFNAMPLPKILFLAGELHAQLGDTEQALHRYQEAAKLDENNIYAYRAELAGAGLCMQLNRRAEALRRYERVARAIPNTDEGKSARQSLRQLQERRQALTDGAK